jgi:DNA-binding transcriptional LysR family regulator
LAYHLRKLLLAMPSVYRLALQGVAMLTDQLRYFVAVARSEHMGRAAEQLDLSQPALSRSIQKLEQELGLPLFDRVGRGVRLNQAGNILLRRVDRACAEFDDAVRELRDFGHTKIVSVGYLSTFGVRLIPEVVKGFRALEPELQFKLFEAPNPLLAKQLLAGELDLCVSTHLMDSALEWRPLFQEELYAIVPRDHRFATRKSIELVEFADEPFVALRAGHGLRFVLDNLCQQAGFKPKIKFEGYEVSSLRGLVSMGLGVTLAPKRPVPATTEVEVPISAPRCFRVVGISWRKARWLAPAAITFRDYVIKELSEEGPNRDGISGEGATPNKEPKLAVVAAAGMRSRRSRDLLHVSG